MATVRNEERNGMLRRIKRTAIVAAGIAGIALSSYAGNSNSIPENPKSKVVRSVPYTAK